LYRAVQGLYKNYCKLTMGVDNHLNSTSDSPKKSYEKPTLRVYGDIKKITKTHPGLNPNKDGGGGGLSKTG
jgi:hypothetical protein